jgi:hypothetical protein
MFKRQRKFKTKISNGEACHFEFFALAISLAFGVWHLGFIAASNLKLDPSGSSFGLQGL